ncbi:MAG: 2-hydroxychromene-2-carboxylate isomerase [Gammaproteobacteria bacterium]
MSKIEWYFDFISPFAYLQSERLHEFPPYGEVHFKPVLFAGLLNHWGQKGPAELPGKRRFSYRHLQWQAQRHGIAFKMPPRHPFNPLQLLRLAIALGCQPQHIQDIFRFVWQEGRDPGNPAELAALQARLGVSDSTIMEQPAIKATLRNNTEQAIGQGIFGVPTILINGELFWGFDATDMALDYLRDPNLFENPEMQRISHLPCGAQRRKE